MSWPGNRAPWMDAAGGVSRTKRDQAQERLYAQCCSVRRALPPFGRAQQPRRQSTRAGRHCCCLRYHLSPSRRPSFSRSRFTEILLRLEFPSLTFPLSALFWLFVCFPPSLLCAFPWFTLSLLPNIQVALWQTCHTAWERVTSPLSLIWACATHLCLSPARPSTNKPSNQLLSAAELLCCGLILSHDQGGPAVPTARPQPGVSLLERNNIKSTTSYPA